ncbi:MAG TPA: hypothetical protein VEA99_01445 [Gemmatimonadaceae bacterium]|nr:hypothetical protein [Gemmatimonadaceae bacterium]
MRRALAVLTALLLVSCDDELTEPRPQSELLEAPTAVTVGAQSLVLEPYVYRDFMPGAAPPGGSAMIAGIRVRATNGAALPRSFRADSVWVIAGPQQVWAAPLAEHRFDDAPPYTYESVARDGPKWAPGTPIDVVVRVRDGSGPPQLLRAPNEVVRQTW